MSNSPDDSTKKVRVQRPQRHQIQWRDASLDQLIPADHRVRQVWAYVDTLDLTPLCRQIQAVEGSAGRDAVDPKILLALWLFATIEGVSSARHLARLCERDLPYLWICGEVGVNHHLLSDFRGQQGDFLDRSRERGYSVRFRPLFPVFVKCPKRRQSVVGPPLRVGNEASRKYGFLSLPRLTCSGVLCRPTEGSLATLPNMPPDERRRSPFITVFDHYSPYSEMSQAALATAAVSARTVNREEEPLLALLLRVANRPGSDVLAAQTQRRLLFHFTIEY